MLDIVAGVLEVALGEVGMLGVVIDPHEVLEPSAFSQPLEQLCIGILALDFGLPAVWDELNHHGASRHPQHVCHACRAQTGCQQLWFEHLSARKLCF